MERWTARKTRESSREGGEDDDEDVLLGPTVVVVGDTMTVDDNLDNVVSRTRRIFDTPGVGQDQEHDFDSWKRRRLAVKRLRGDSVGHGQRGGEEQGAGDDNVTRRVEPVSVSEIGISSNEKNNTNHDCSSLPGGDNAGVQCREGVQDGGGVVGGDPALLSTTPQLESRGVGSFLSGDVLPDRSAAGMGEPVLRGKADSTNFARKII